jgi:hypothetical protein
VEIDEIFGEGNGFPAKFMDTHLWIRLGADGVPQIIRVEPMVTDEGQLIPQNVVLFIDEAGPTIMDRDAADMMLSTPNCVPLEKMLQWKHRIRH